MIPGPGPDRGANWGAGNYNLGPPTQPPGSPSKKVRRGSMRGANANASSSSNANADAGRRMLVFVEGLEGSTSDTTSKERVIDGEAKE